MTSHNVLMFVSAERFDGRPTTNALQDAVADKSLPATPGVGAKSGAEQKKEIMERLQPQGKPIDVGKHGKKEHWERDPTTGMDVLVKDPSFESESSRDWSRRSMSDLLCDRVQGRRRGCCCSRSEQSQERPR